MQRLVQIAMMSRSVTYIHEFSDSNDSMNSLVFAQAIGCNVIVNSKFNFVRIDSRNISSTAKKFEVGESGYLLRSMPYILMSLFPNIEFEIFFRGTLKDRNIDELISNLLRFAIKVQKTNDSIIFKGSLPNVLYVVANDSSQCLSGAIISANKNIQIISAGKSSKSKYVDLTIDLATRVNSSRIQKVQDDTKVMYSITDGYINNECHLKVNADWSGVAFNIAHSIVNNIDIKITDVHTDMQPDSNILKILDYVGVRYICNDGSLTVFGSENVKLNTIDIDLTGSPDLFPPVAAICTKIYGKCKIKGIDKLINKESNRLENIINVLTAANVKTEIVDNSLLIRGTTLMNRSFDVSDANDHRIAMMISVLTNKPAKLESIKKSYPSYNVNIFGNE